MMMIMMNCFCGIADQRKALTLYEPNPQNAQTHSNNLLANCLSVFDLFMGLALKEFSFISSQDHCQMFLPSQTSDTPKLA